MLAATVCTTGCKDDSEDDLNVGPSDVAGVFINEVCSSGTDWIELYNASDKEISLGAMHVQDNKGNEDQTTQRPSEEEIKEPGYFYTSGNTEDYLSIDAVEIIPNESSITAVDKEGKEESIDLTDSKYRLGRATITVTVEQNKTITLTRSDKDPLIYTYEE